MPKINNKISRLEIKDRLYERRYLVPNLVTVGNLFCGFLTIIYAASGRFEKAIIAIFIALLLDGLDGRVARRLNATTKFGVEFDSFSDLVSFGIAPAILVYHWCFQLQADEFGVFIGFIYALCAASRLARFNISVKNLKGFQGLPTPGAAAMLASMVFIRPAIYPSLVLVVAVTALVLLVSYLMVSNVSYFSIKTIKIHRFPLFARLALFALIPLAWYRPQIAFFLLAMLYMASGPLLEGYYDWKKSAGEEAESLADRVSIAK